MCYKNFLSIILILSVLTSCSGWRKFEAEGVQLPWSAPDTRTNRWLKDRSCLSLTGNCSSVKWRNHHGDKIEIDTALFEKMVTSHLWKDEILFWGFVDLIRGGEINKRNPVVTHWRNGNVSTANVHCRSIPYYVNVISVNPDIIMLSEDTKCLRKRLYVPFQAEKLSLAREKLKGIKKLYLEVTPEYVWSLTSETIRRYEFKYDLNLDTEVPYQAPGKIWLFNLDKEEVISLDINKLHSIKLGDKDFLSFQNVRQSLIVKRSSIRSDKY